MSLLDPNFPSLRDEGLRFLQGELLEVARHVAAELATTANERDRQGGNPKAQRDLLRQSGLLAASVESALGGAGANWSEILDIVRLFARADGSLAHVFGFHHLMLATLKLFGTEAQWRPLLLQTVAKRWFWGNALNPLEQTTSITRVGTGYVIDGRKSFSSGSVDSDQLIVSAVDPSTKKLVVVAIPSARKGVHIVGDWDNMGQRQTDSGSVEFSDVAVTAQDILAQPGPLGSTLAGLRPLFAQLILVNVYLGLAEGALTAARGYTLSAKRAWLTSGVASPAQDPFVLRHYGEYFVQLEAARLLADQAAETLTLAYQKQNDLTPEERGLAAVRIASAKVATTRASLDVTAGIFDVMGARATTAKLNFDRYWRNARTHTLHDPVDYKLRELGEFALARQLPKPSFYT